MRLHLGNDSFHRSGVEEVLLWVIVGGSGHHHKVRIPVRQRHFCGGQQIQLRRGKVLLNLLVHNGRHLAVNQGDLVLVNIKGHHLVVLSQKDGVGKPHIPCTHNGYIHRNAPPPILPDFPEWGKSGRLALPPPTHDTLR